jgi:dihydropyrimidinase
MSLLIKNGEVVTASERFVGDVWCEGETITRIGRGLQAPSGAEVIDAAGKYVFPGFIDPHVHIYLPVMGTCTKDTHETASKAALVGGTTTLIEMICPTRRDEPLEAFETWLGKARGHSACDFSFHMGVTRYDDRAEQQLIQIVRRGITSFKVLLAYKDAGGINDEELCRTLLLARKLGVLTAAHCENADLIEALQQQLLGEGKTGPEWHHDSRPPVI